MTVGQRIKEFREEERNSQEELGRRAGVSTASISKIEQGKVRQPTRITLLGIANALDVAEGELLKEPICPVKSNEKAIELLEEWLNDESGYDEEAWSELKARREQTECSCERGHTFDFHTIKCVNPDCGVEYTIEEWMDRTDAENDERREEE